MAKKEKRKRAEKNSQLVLRVNKEERNQFVELCHDMDTTAAREIRGFIRKFIKKHS
ncbi:MAG: hypothetical protein AAGF53_02675 [Pseudomonadota bacterium]